MRELDVQSALVKAARAEGGFAFKAASKFLVGVLDLFIQMPDFVGCWVEVKHLNRMPARGVARLELTPLQAKFLNELRQAGGTGGWVLAIAGPRPGDYHLVAGTAIVSTVNLGQWPLTFRARGAPWPIRDLIQRISYRKHPL